ncbi:PspC domain-containing protein [Modestobacter lapidis]|nr:PspC domain-containing protein [Modestobacter lapidis]
MTSAPPPAYPPPAGELPPGPFPPPPPGADQRPPLHRSRTNKVIGGVAGGLAEYTGIDALLWRVGFVAVTLAWGVGLIIYPLLWLLMPPAAAGQAAQVTQTPRAPHGPRSPVPGITLAALLIVMGIGALVSRFTDWDLGARGFLGSALVVVGIGLVIAAVTGAGRGARSVLVVLGGVLSLAAMVSTTDPVPEGSVGDRTYRPMTADAVQDRYDSGVGDLTLDLTRLDLSDLDGPLPVLVNSGIGDVAVIVPRSADVRVSVDNGLGEADVFGDSSDSGFYPGTGSAAWTDDDLAEFRLTVESGIGDVKVSRG